MFDHLFENRNTTVTNLLKLGDCLGRSLRENLELFSIDSEDLKVAFLTDSGKVITGDYTLKESVALHNIKIEDVDIFTDNQTFDTFVNEQVTSFVGNLNSEDFGEANNSFSNILSLWENRIKFEKVKKSLDEKTALFNPSQVVLECEEFQRFLEVMPQFLSFLEENREKISKVKEINNAIKLSNSVSQAFNFPRITHEDLQETGTYSINSGVNKSIYEMICKRELVGKELVESKTNFEHVWATNSKIRNLAGLVFETSDDVVLESLVDAILDVPYLALATKKQIFDSVDNALGLTENSSLSIKEIKSFSSRIFEMKKPLKKILINILNEKYGITISNLKNTPTFGNLAETQVVIFEALSRLAPKGSLLKSTLGEVAHALKEKNGVEVIDVNNIIQEAFEVCNYDNFSNEYTLIENFDFETIFEEELTPAEVLEVLKEKKELLFDRDEEAAKINKEMEDHEARPESETDDEDDSVASAEKKAKKTTKKKTSKKDTLQKEEVVDEAEAEKEEDPPGEDSGSEEKPPKDEDSISDDSFMKALRDMDELMNDLDAEEEETQVKKAKEDEIEA